MTGSSPGPLDVLRSLDVESYWADEYLAEVTPTLAARGWLMRPVNERDEAAVTRCFDAIDDLDMVDNAPFGVLWALRSTKAIGLVDGLDRELADWRGWIETEYFKGEPLDLPDLDSTPRWG